MSLSLRRELIEYVVEHTEAFDPSYDDHRDLIDVHFFKVFVDDQFDPEHFKVCMAYSLMGEGKGEFGDINEERAKGGPSYIEWGGWIGDQGLAMRMMACGQKAGLWKVITPATLHVTGKDADDMAGKGFVMTSGYTSDFDPNP